MTVLLLILLGLALGSFVNAFVWRLHMQSLSKKRQKRLSIISGRSMCSSCQHPLAWYDLIPVISWVSLGGECRYCHKKIQDSPLVELSLAGLFVLSFIVWPYGFGGYGNILFAGWLVTLVVLLAMTIYDLKWMLLPDKLTKPLIALWVLIALMASLTKQDSGVLIGAVLGLIFCGGVFWALFQVSKGNWIGGGDVKLGFSLGLMSGSALKGLLVIFIASVLGLLWAMPQLLQGKANKTSKIPFGPFLIAAGILIFLFGNTITSTFLSIYPR